MKSLFFGVALAAAAFPALAQSNVSISIGQPGFYGHIDIGDFGRPPVVYAQPVIVEPRVRYAAAPVYLRVPEGHRKHWSKHCARYNACGQQVLFVRDDWYTNTYAPRYRERHYRVVEQRPYYGDQHERRDNRDEHGRGHGEGRGHDRGHGEGHGEGRGHGEGHGRGHGHD